MELIRLNNLFADSLLHQLGRTENAQDVELQVWDPNIQQKIKINGVLECGAFTKAGSYALHGQYCKTVKEVRNNVFL